MQYLPGILKLQKYMFDHFHQQVGQERSLDGTIGKYKETLTDGNNNYVDSCAPGVENSTPKWRKKVIWGDYH